MDAQAQKILEGSGDSISSAFGHFSVPPSQTSVTRGRYEAAEPTAGGSKTGKFEITVPAADGVYTDLSTSYLQIEARVVKADGNVVPNAIDGTHVWPKDNLAHSLFERIVVSMNGRDVEHISNYATYAYISNLINYDSETQRNVLGASSGWIADNSRGKDAADNPDADIAKRKTLVKNSPALSFTMRPRSAVLASEAYLFPGTSLTITFHRSPASFCLFATDNSPTNGASVVIDKITLYANRLKANASLFSSQMELALAGNSINYPIRRIKERTKLLVAGETMASLSFPTQQQRPSRIIVAMIHAGALSGDFSLNPYKFSHYSVTSFECKVEGLGDSILYETDFATGAGLARPYASLAQSVGRFETERPFALSFEDWKNGSTLWAFDLSEEKSRDGSTFQLVRSGRLSFNIRFGAALPHNVSVLFFTEQDDVIRTGLNNDISTLVPVL